LQSAFFWFQSQIWHLRSYQTTFRRIHPYNHVFPWLKKFEMHCIRNKLRLLRWGWIDIMRLLLNWLDQLKQQWLAQDTDLFVLLNSQVDKSTNYTHKLPCSYSSLLNVGKHLKSSQISIQEEFSHFTFSKLQKYLCPFECNLTLRALLALVYSIVHLCWDNGQRERLN